MISRLLKRVRTPFSLPSLAYKFKSGQFTSRGDSKGLGSTFINFKRTNWNIKNSPFMSLAVPGFAALMVAEESKRSIIRGPNTEIIDNEANLLEYPTDRISLNKNCQLTIGDLHGNALKLIYFLVRHNILNLNRENYHIIIEIYQKKTNEITKEDIIKFNTILESAQFHTIPSGVLIRLIGDELADRGSNDYFVLKVLEKMKKNNIPFEILFSNHGLEFIKVYGKGLLDNKSYLEKYDGGFAQSLANLRSLVKRKIISLEEVDALVKHYYLPHLKLISYSLQQTISYNSSAALADPFEMKDAITHKENLTLYSHAPIGIETIKFLCQLEGIQVPYSEKTGSDLANSIEQINRKFSDIAINQQILATFGKELAQKIKVDDIPLELPILRTIWSRGYQNKDIPLSALNRCTLFYAHGHDGNGKVNDAYKNHVTNLDNEFGKDANQPVGRYSVLLSQQK